ncbi:aspartate aminotransferase family protein [Paremcibacter congregatus]|uniref:Aspartate aminotransferase family protein n=1 Tax=Paremcibacter congregatus TaxID=2043170 RepID=A0A2G4YT63_9PROT|nr:aminotransferase class III-fold pyridoxal phosphate-dependent enzyme [Paremcibacter congregatus]PHZ85483.1 aspartate aminotransferase family protein [Paremcibacter congregatus]QDE28033.1 aminotransferase class III-fold pyridoxal phosphate-dependent enzyme [Paremcibacter congregatus]
MFFKIQNNISLTERFSQLYPGAHSNNSPAAKVRSFQLRAEGARWWDVDNNEYIDYTGASGPNILGHRHPEYVNALQEFMGEKSFCMGSSYIFSEDDILLAEKLIQHVPCAEKIKLCVSGSEAVQQAIRLARAFTGRPYFLRFGGHYHGWIDNIYGGNPDPSPEGKPFPLYDSRSNTRGKSQKSNYEGLMIPWGDLDVLEQTLHTHGKEIAIIIMEAVCGSGTLPPPPGYLETVRALCDRHRIVMCFDEVITGFRVGLHGAQGLFGVTPDICTLGKALGGGLPISAIVGKSDILDQLKDEQVMGPGTFNGNPLCVAAAKATIEILERKDGIVYTEMDRVQQQLMAGVDEIARRRNIPMRVQGPTGVFGTFLGANPDKQLYTAADMASVDNALMMKFHEEIWHEGVSALFGRWFPSIVHTEKDTEKTLEVVDKIIKKL